MNIILKKKLVNFFGIVWINCSLNIRVVVYNCEVTRYIQNNYVNQGQSTAYYGHQKASKSTWNVPQGNLFFGTSAVIIQDCNNMLTGCLAKSTGLSRSCWHHVHSLAHCNRHHLYFAASTVSQTKVRLQSFPLQTWKKHQKINVTKLT